MKNKAASELQKLKKIQSMLGLNKYARVYLGAIVLIAAILLVFQDQLNVVPPRVSLQDVATAATEAAIQRRNIPVTKADSFLRLTGTYDNYNRCQNKLGLHHEASSTDAAAIENSINIIRNQGGKFILASYDNPSQLQAASDFVLNSRRQNLRAIIELKGERFGGNPQAMIAFFQAVSERTQDSIFIATASADYATYQNMKAQGRVASSGQALGEDIGAVAAALRADEDIIIASPILQQFQLPKSQCLEVSGGDEGVCYKLDSADEWRLYNQVHYVFDALDQDLIDIHLISITNAELGFGNLTSNDEETTDETNEALRASFAFSKYMQVDLENFNTKYDAFRRAIIVDFGPQSDTNDMERPQMQRRLLYDYGLLSDNPLIEGIIVGQSLRSWFQDTQLSRLHLEGTNCNYDSVDYETASSESRAAAPVCGERTVNSATKAKVRVVCAEALNGGTDGQCLAQVRFTLKVGLPILHCGSNSVFGTDTRPFLPPAVKAAIQYHTPLDYLNQYASNLSTSDSSPSEDYSISNYPLPWLGTCLASSYPDYSSTTPPLSEWDLTTNFGSKGLSLNNYRQEAATDHYKRKAYSAVMSTYTDTADERYFVWGRDLVINKDNLTAADSNNFSLLDYGGNNYQSANQCGGKVLSVVNDPQNYVYGSEMIIEDKELFSKSSNTLAYEEYVYRIRNNGNHLFTGKNVFEVKNTSPSAGCGCALPGEATPGSRAWSSYMISQGCELTPQQITGGQCITYRGGEGSLDQYSESDFEVEVDFPEFPQYKIDGAYDTLAALYNRVQTKLSSMGRKLIINSKRGWQADLSIKAYHLPPYYNPREIEGARENNMLEQVTMGGDRPFNVALNNGPQSRVPQLGIGTVAGASDEGDSGNQCKSGVNFGVGVIPGDKLDEAVGYGYGYGQMLTVAHNPSGDASMMSAMCDKGITPILRYCYTGGPCAFEQPVMNSSTAYERGKQLGNYYRSVAAMAAQSCSGRDIPMYFTCGHNEPISEYVTHNNLDPQTGMRTEGMFSKGCVDQLNADGEKVKAMTSIFNATIGDAPDGKYTRASTNVTNFITGYGGTSEMAGDMDSGNLSCIALNTYSFGTNPDQLSGYYYDQVMKSPLVPPNAKGCVNETGWVGTTQADQNANAESVVESLLSAAGDSLEFFLYYNATGTATSEWDRFKLTPEKNEKIGQCQVDVTPTPGNDDPTKPTFVDEYNMMLTEGDNFARQFQYYEYLENINYLHFIDTVYLSDASQSDALARSLVGLPLCEDLSGDARNKVDCLAPYAEPSSRSYRQDPLGKFLCSKGYDVAGENCQRQCTTTVTNPSVTPGQQPVTEVTSTEDFPVGFRNLADEVEANMCIPRGLLYALIERETPGGISLITGDPYQKLYERPNYAGAWGPAQFTDIAWSTYNNPAYGKETGAGFIRDPYGTKYCLDKVGAEYSNSQLWESNDPFVLNRSVMIYALCGAAAKLKADSRTGAKCENWSVEEVYSAARAYLGACEQNGRQYCSSYVATICALFPAENAQMCSELGYEVKVQCEDDPAANECGDGIIRLAHPLKQNAARALVSQEYGGSEEHAGIDYAIVTGTPVYAAASGRVTRVVSTATGNTPGSTGDVAAGNFVKIMHTRPGMEAYYTSYQHLNTVDVEVGDVVEIGDKIGTVGNTGNSTGSHLHFELRLKDCYDGYGDGEPFGSCTTDPANYILTEEDLRQCKVNPDQNRPTAGVCPVSNPGSARISQGSVQSPLGQALGSHGESFISPQNPTDIAAAGQTARSPIKGVVEAVMNPRETFDLYQIPDLCNYARKSDGELFYEGGFAIYIREDGTDNLWRFVHLEIPTVTEGQAVEPGTELGRIFDGTFSSTDVYDGINWDDYDTRNTGCFSSSRQHLHFAIISSNAAPKPAAGATPQQKLETYRQNPTYIGNNIDSVPWVQEACGF